MTAKSWRERPSRRQAQLLDQMRAKINEVTGDNCVTVHKLDLQRLVWAAERDAKRQTNLTSC
jgi:hypothetical protein